MLVQVAQVGADLCVFGGGRDVAAVDERLAAGEQPRVAEGGAANHQAVEAVARKQGFCLFGAFDVAVGNHRQTGFRFGCGDGGVVGFALVTLRAAAAMHGKGGNAAGFGDARHFCDDRLAVVVAEAGFQCYRDVHRAHYGGEYFFNLAEVGQERRACLLFGDGFRRAAHVEVDDVGTFGLHQ